MEKRDLNIFASYFQFVVKDENSKEDISYLWDKDTIRDLLIVGNDVIGIGTVRDLTVPVTVEILGGNPTNDDIDEWDQIVQCEIELPSGKIVVMSVTDYFPEAARFTVKPGKHRVRIYYGELNSLSLDGLDGNDNYKVVLWKAEEDRGVVFIKRRNAND